MMTIRSIRPNGWLKTMMEEEVRRHVVDKLPDLIPDLFGDDLFDTDRIGPQTKPKDLGTLENDASWNAQFFWWNAETIGNYFDGLMRYGFLLDNPEIIGQARKFVEHILQSQDENGYIGIYTKDFRYRFASENGELWAKTTIGRLLLGYHRFAKDERSFVAVKRMTDELMSAWPMHQSAPFGGTQTFAGVAHGLMFVDVLYALYRSTKERKYLDYALFLYEDYNRHEVSEPDCLIRNLNNPDYRFQGHGVHTYEHLRAIAIYDAFGDKKLDLVAKYLEKLMLVLSPSGGPIGDEWILGNVANADLHGYEFCSTHELMASLLFVGELGLSNQYPLALRIYRNAGLGSRHQTDRTVAYLKSDNSYAMEGCFHQPQSHSPHKIQTRYKYSPTHQDAAVCCAPNGLRITPYFLDGIATVTDDLVVLNMKVPVAMEFAMADQAFYLHVNQDDPYAEVSLETNLGKRLVIRDSGTSDKILRLKDLQGKVHFEWNGFVFAYPIPSTDQTVKAYPFGLRDVFVVSQDKHEPLIDAGSRPTLVWDEGRPRIRVKMVRNGVIVDAILVPVGETTLRQVTFQAL